MYRCDGKTQFPRVIGRDFLLGAFSLTSVWSQVGRRCLTMDPKVHLCSRIRVSAVDCSFVWVARSVSRFQSKRINKTRHKEDGRLRYGTPRRRDLQGLGSPTEDVGHCSRIHVPYSQGKICGSRILVSATVGQIWSPDTKATELMNGIYVSPYSSARFVSNAEVMFFWLFLLFEKRKPREVPFLRCARLT